MKVLVTGGTGFIGQWAVLELMRRDHQPIVFDRHGRQVPDSVEKWIGDIRDGNGLMEAMSHVDGFLHLAGVLGTQETIEHPIPAAETNVLGGLNVLEAASAHDRPGVYIAVGNWWMENTYSISKTAVERFCAMYRLERGLRVKTVRAFNAYGPGQSVAEPYGPSKVRKIIPSFVCRALAGHDIEIYGDGHQIMDMVSVADVARILVDSLDHAAGDRPLYKVAEAGTGRKTSVNFIAETVIELAESESKIVHLPMRAGEPDHANVLAERADYHMAKLEDALPPTIEWYRENWLPTWSG